MHPGNGHLFAGAAHIMPLYLPQSEDPVPQMRQGGGSLWSGCARSVLPAFGMVIPFLRTLQGNLEGKLLYKPSTSWQLKKCVCVCVRAHHFTQLCPLLGHRSLKLSCYLAIGKLVVWDKLTSDATSQDAALCLPGTWGWLGEFIGFLFAHTGSSMCSFNGLFFSLPRDR